MREAYVKSTANMAFIRFMNTNKIYETGGTANNTFNITSTRNYFTPNIPHHFQQRYTHVQTHTDE